MNTAREIAAALGNARREGRGWRCNCPVHGGRSLVINDGRDGRLLIRCWGGNCDARDIFTALRKRNLLGNPRARWAQPSDPDAMQRHREAEERNRQHRIAVALDLWQNETYPATDTIVERYLRSRGIIIPPPATIRMAGLMRHRESGEQRPAMVALVEHVEHGPIAVHITYIALDGSMKATIVPNKRSLGPVGGGAVRLAQAAETLMVAEGIETCLAAMQSTRLPGWAALSTSGMKALVLPPVVREIIILADHDANGAGERAAGTAAERWFSEGRRVRIAIPPEPDTDFADLLALRGITPTLGVTHVAG